MAGITIQADISIIISNNFLRKTHLFVKKSTACFIDGTFLNNRF